ncbi:hypothetical protein SK128_024697 [Halocaridina rubra]|uniref:Uncharacterized protein n=1 Tax=Halocaridina rubra TaxID=373956 RepID=A0AAN8XR41_HALRR
MAEKSLFRNLVWLFITDNEMISENSSLPFLKIDNKVTFATVTNTSKSLTVELREVYQIAEYLPRTNRRFGSWKEGGHVNIPISSWINRRSNLTGLHLRCTTLSQPPFLYLSEPDVLLNVKLTGGYAANAWHTLQEQLGFTYSCRQPADGEWGSQSTNGDWNGLVRDILENSADVVVTSLDRNEARSRAIDYLVGLREVGYQLVARRVGLMDSTWTSFTSELVPASWTVTMVFAILVPPILTLVAYFSPKETVKITLKDAYIITIGAFTAQGSDTDVKSISTRIVFITIFLTTLLVYAHYTSALVSLFTVASTSTDFSNLQDLVADGSYKLGFLRGISIQNEFEKATYGQYHDAWNKLVQGNPDNLPTSQSEGIRRVVSEKYIYMMEENLYRSDYSNDCDTVMMDGKYFRQQTGFAVAKGSPIQDIFNAKLMRMRDGGVLSRLWQTWQPPPALCTIDSVYALDIKQFHWNITGKEKALQRLLDSAPERRNTEIVSSTHNGFFSRDNAFGSSTGGLFSQGRF